MRGLAAQYLNLCKPKVVALIVFTAMVGMLLASPEGVDWLLFVLASLGIGLSAASAAAINHLIDRKADAVMARTRNRPMPSGHLGFNQVLVFACVLGLVGLTMLALWVNLLTTALTFFSLIGYAIVYTVWLKHATPQNIVIGGAAGAAPPLLGWVAMTGQLDPQAYILFLIIFAWTPPHFWALAIYRRHDYAAVNIPMLPVSHGVPFTRWQILFYTLLLFMITLLPYLTGMSGLVYLGAAVALGGGFLYYAVRLLLDTEREALAMQTFGYSVIYLMALFSVLLIDHYLPLAHPLFLNQ